MLLEVHKLYKLQHRKKEMNCCMLGIRKPNCGIKILHVSYLICGHAFVIVSLVCVCECVWERWERQTLHDRLCKCDLLMHQTTSVMLVHAMQTSGGSVWFGWRLWLYLPRATWVYLTDCSSCCCSHKSAKTLTIRSDYYPSPVACCRWPVIFLFFRLITKTAKQAKCVGCLSASLALLDYLTLLTPVISC